MLTLCLLLSAAHPFARKASSEVRETRDGVHARARTVITQRYSFAVRDVRASKIALLLSDRAEVTTRTDADGDQAVHVIDAFVDDRGAYDKRVWSVRDDSVEASVESVAGGGTDSVLETVKRGCCGAVDTARAYNLTSGALVLTYDDELDRRPATLEVANQDVSRIAGFLSVVGAAGMPPNPPAELVGVLSYASNQKLLDQARIVHAKAARDLLGPPRLLFHGAKSDPRPWLQVFSTAAMPQALDGTWLRVSFDDVGDVEIPIVKDKLDIAHARTPAALKILAGGL